MMNDVMSGRVEMRVTTTVRSQPVTRMEILDGVLTLVERIRMLEDRRSTAFWASAVGRRRSWLRIHAEAAALLSALQYEAASRAR